MALQPRYSREEHALLGEEIYERQLRDRLEPSHHGKIVAIDVDTGEHEIADDVLSATRLLLARLPNAQIWCIRIGYQAVHRFGSRSVRVNQ